MFLRFFTKFLFVFVSAGIFVSHVGAIDSVLGGQGLVDESHINGSSTGLLQDLTIIDSDFTAGESVTISFDTSGNPTGDLKFSGSPTFSTTNGLTLGTPVVTDSQITVEVTNSSNASITISDIGIYLDNFGTTGEFFELRNLEVDNGIAPVLQSEDFVVDTTDYTSVGNFSGSTGSADGNTFKINDNLNYDFAPFNFSTRGDFVIDLNDIEGTSTHDTTTSFTIIPGDDDNLSQSFTSTLNYTGLNVSKSFSTKGISIDNEAPVADGTGFSWFELPADKTILGIGDEVALNLPTESTGDDITFTADFSAIASAGTFIDELIDTAKTFTITEGNVDTDTFVSTVTYEDNAGNTTILSTDSLNVDNIRPTVYNTNILSLLAGTEPGTIGDTIVITPPVDNLETRGAANSFSIDMTDIGGAGKNFENINSQQSVIITPGTYNYQNVFKYFSIIDKAGNESVLATNGLLIDNKVPTFDTSCGGTFAFLEDVDGNQIADLSNQGNDTIVFSAPNRNSPNCDFHTFSIDLSVLSGFPIQNMVDLDALGQTYVISILPGTIDDPSYSLPLSIKDQYGNTNFFNTGTISIDNEVSQASFIKESSSITKGLVSSDGSVIAPGTVRIRVDIFPDDIQSVKAKIEGGSTEVILTKVEDYWEGDMQIISGRLVKDEVSVTYTITDDAGNETTLDGSQKFMVTNDTRKKGGGGGGSLNIGKLENQSNLRKFVPNQSREFYEKTWKAQKIEAAERHRKSLATRLTPLKQSLKKLRRETPNIIIERKNRIADSRERMLMRYPSKARILENKLKPVAFPLATKKERELLVDNVDGLKVRNSLQNLKNAHRKTTSVRYRPLRELTRPGIYLQLK